MPDSSSVKILALPLNFANTVGGTPTRLIAVASAGILVTEELHDGEEVELRTGGATKRKSEPKVVVQVDASVVDIFCGAGGLSHGFLQQGFKIAGGVDIDEQCRYAFESNNYAPFIRRDVSTLTAKEVSALFLPKKASVLVGCAPCQPFSTYVSPKLRCPF